jgi:parvulin-like peptidyl-prolyl isomerase
MAQEPDRILLQHVLISFRETPVEAPRSRTEAESLAQEILQRALGGEDFSELVRGFSDDVSQEGAARPGTFLVLNHNSPGDGSFERTIAELNQRAERYQAELERRIEAGEMGVPEAEQGMEEFIEALRAESDEARAASGFPRAALVPAFGDVGFRLQCNEIGLAPHDERSSPFGWHVIKRLE